MAHDTIKTTIAADGRATVTLNRPEVHNAFDDALIAALRGVLDDLAARDEVRLVVLASEGKSFSAGADLNWMKRMAGYSEAENLADSMALAHMLQRLDTMPVPTIARVQGAALGGGVGLVACCDVAVASEGAKFSLSEVRLGLIPATIGPYVLNAIGPRQARRYFLTAERFDAAEAQRIGLVHAVCAPDDLDTTVDAVAGELLKGGPAALRQGKALIERVTGGVPEAVLADTAERIARIRAEAEGREGVAAFLEKRKPSWIGDG
ncbi:MAG: enoyl-CoA hydratase/isomerase family protein [Rhodospirillaceae bacterium]|jgi:methylglutaconyl-CoA hydratase|nr:enoyl-CoA hydratase/isomerase family protein [Rhodospirillaceae bacterium]MBT6116576.1 enoyl-CoA hydratase/isomerase family protein [Rhodospirillaceae bacterium]